MGQPGRTRWVSLDDNVVGTSYTVDGLLPASGYMFVVRGHDPEFGWPAFLDIPESNVVYTEGTVPCPLFGLVMTETAKDPVAGRAVSDHRVSMAWEHGRVNGDAIDDYEVMWMCEDAAAMRAALEAVRLGDEAAARAKAEAAAAAKAALRALEGGAGGGGRPGSPGSQSEVSFGGSSRPGTAASQRTEDGAEEEEAKGEPVALPGEDAEKGRLWLKVRTRQPTATFTLRGLLPGTKYCFVVRAHNE